MEITINLAWFAVGMVAVVIGPHILAVVGAIVAAAVRRFQPWLG